MSQPLRKNNFARPSLRQARTPRTVLLRMAADADRAERIRGLKQQRPDLKWRVIAAHVGVTERAAQDWAAKGGMEYENAEKLAALFEVDVDYIWRGTPENTPNPFQGADDRADQLDRIETLLRENQQIMLALAAGLRTETPVRGGPPWAALDRLREELAARDRQASQPAPPQRRTSTG